MSEWALVLVLTCTGFLPELADFGLEFHLKSLNWFGTRVLTFSCVIHLLLTLDDNGLLLLQFLLFVPTRLFLLQIAALLEVLYRSWSLKIVKLLLPRLGFLFRVEVLLSWIALRRSLFLLLKFTSLRHLWCKTRLKGCCLWIILERFCSNILCRTCHLGWVLRTCVGRNIEVGLSCVLVDLCYIHRDRRWKCCHLRMKPEPVICILLLKITRITVYMIIWLRLC